MHTRIHFAFPELFRNTYTCEKKEIVGMSFEKPLKERIQRSANITLLRKNMKIIKKREKKYNILCLSWGSNPPTKLPTIANQVY